MSEIGTPMRQDHNTEVAIDAPTVVTRVTRPNENFVCADLGSLLGMSVNNPAPNASPSREPAGSYRIVVGTR